MLYHPFGYPKISKGGRLFFPVIKQMLDFLTKTKCYRITRIVYKPVLKPKLLQLKHFNRKIYSIIFVKGAQAYSVFSSFFRVRIWRYSFTGN